MPKSSKPSQVKSRTGWIFVSVSPCRLLPHPTVLPPSGRAWWVCKIQAPPPWLQVLEGCHCMRITGTACIPLLHVQGRDLLHSQTKLLGKMLGGEQEHRLGRNYQPTSQPRLQRREPERHGKIRCVTTCRDCRSEPRLVFCTLPASLDNSKTHLRTIPRRILDVTSPIASTTRLRQALNDYVNRYVTISFGNHSEVGQGHSVLESPSHFKCGRRGYRGIPKGTYTRARFATRRRYCTCSAFRQARARNFLTARLAGGLGSGSLKRDLVAVAS